MADQKTMIDAFLLDASKYRKDGNKPLGTGRFGDIYLYECTEGDKEKVAVRIANGGGATVQSVFREVDIFSKVRPHPCICRSIGFFAQPPAIVTEYMPNGSLQRILDKLWKGEKVTEWTDTLRAKIIFGVAVAMQHLHAHSAIHRYLTPASIMFDANWEPKLTDFGFAKVTTNSTTMTIVAPDESAYIYTAPEALVEGSYTGKIDVYAYGMIIYSVATGQKPEPEAARKEKTILKKQNAIVSGARPEIPDDINGPLGMLIENCWGPEAGNRPSFAEIVRDLRNYDEKLFPDVDMDEYTRYRNAAIEGMEATEDDKKILSEARLRPEDIDAFERVKRQGDGGDVRAIVRLGKMYQQGIGVNKDEAEAFRHYQQAAALGDPVGMLNTGQALLYGLLGEKKDPKAGADWIRRAKETGRLGASADVAYARCLEMGLGVEKNYNEALELYTKASEAPYKRADAMYGRGRVLVALKRAPEAVTWFDRASESGADGAACDLAVLLLEGKDLPEDIPRGILLLERAAGRSLPTAKFNLGCICEKGLFGQPQDTEKAKRLFRESAEGGNVTAHLKLSGMLLGEANKLDKENPDRKELEREAFAILKKAEGSGNAIVLNNLGKLTLTGRGTECNVQAGIAYLSRSAGKNDGGEFAALYLGDLLANGNADLGVRADKNTARTYYEKAKKIGERKGDRALIDKAQAKLDSLH